MYTHQVFDTLKQLDKDLARLDLGQLLLHDNPVEQLALGSKLQNQIDAIVLVECILKAEQCGMADSHEYSNFLLQPVDLGLFTRARALLKLFHGKADSRVLFDAQVHGCKMTLAQLLLHSILLVEAIGDSVERVPKNEAGLVEDSNLVALLQLSPLVAANDGVVDKGTVGRQVLEDSDGPAALVLAEEQAVTV